MSDDVAILFFEAAAFAGAAGDDIARGWARLHEAAMRGAVGGAWSASQILETCRADGALGVVATEAFHDDPRVPIGVILARRVLDEAEIFVVAVRPDRRRRRVASAMLRAALSRLESDGAHRVRLEVSVANVAARRLYEASGFSAVGLRRAYYAVSGGGRSDAVILEKCLGEGE